MADFLKYLADLPAEKWDKTVNKNDIVIIPGDISSFSKIPNLDLQWLDARPGIKIVGAGNHDKWWPKKLTQRKDIMNKYKSIFLLDVNNDYQDEQIIVVGGKECESVGCIF